MVWGRRAGCGGLGSRIWRRRKIVSAIAGWERGERNTLSPLWYASYEVWWWERKTGNGKCGIEESEKGRGDDEGNVIIGNAAVYNEQSRHKEVQYMAL